MGRYCFSDTGSLPLEAAENDGIHLPTHPSLLPVCSDRDDDNDVERAFLFFRLDSRFTIAFTSLHHTARLDAMTTHTAHGDSSSSSSNNNERKKQNQKNLSRLGSRANTLYFTALWSSLMRIFSFSS